MGVVLNMQDYSVILNMHSHFSTLLRLYRRFILDD